MADSTAWTPLSGWTENGDGSWSQVPTAQAEPRLDGYLPIVGGTLAGLVVTVTPTAASAGFRLPHGTAPSSPTDGDVWTTTAGLYVRINGATVGPLGVGGGGGTPATYALSAARNLTNGTGAQSIFGVGFTLAGSTSYLLEMEVAISCSGTTTAIKSLGFALGGTLTSIGFNLMYTHSATSVGKSAASNNLWVATNAATAMGATGTTNYTRISLRGVVRSNATGTFTPQITYSAAPGAAPAVQANSYITLTPIGNDTVQGVGAWV